MVWHLIMPMHLFLQVGDSPILCDSFRYFRGLSFVASFSWALERLWIWCQIYPHRFTHALDSKKKQFSLFFGPMGFFWPLAHAEYSKCLQWHSDRGIKATKCPNGAGKSAARVAEAPRSSSAQSRCFQSSETLAWLKSFDLFSFLKRVH